MKYFLIINLACLASLGTKAQEVPLKRLYLANDTHTDLMWNGSEEEWGEWTREMAEFYLFYGERTAAREPALRCKWNFDASWCLYSLEKNTDPAFFNRLMEMYRNGQASVPYNFTLPTYGGFTAETILRSFYYAGTLERKYGIDIEIATCIENAVIPLGLASLWAGSGAKYSWKGVCNCATKINVKGDRDHEIYWYTGLDGSRILMKWYSMYGPNAELGGYSEMLEPSVAVRQMDELCGTDRYPYRIAGAFSKGWDNARNFSIDVHALAKHRTLPGTQVILSNEMDFFHDFEATYGEVLPSETLAYGNEWDLYPASLPAVTAQLRRSMEELRTAEALAALADRASPGRYSDLDPLKEDFYYGLSVYGLHGWTADGPWVSREDFAEWARQQQVKVTRYVDTLFERGLEDLGGMIPAEKKGRRLFVFNALNFERSGMVRIPVLPPGEGFMKNLSTGSVQPVYRAMPGSKDDAWFISGKIPATGYQVYEWIEKGRSRDVEDPFRVTGEQVETPYYRLRITSDGVITSLVEKKTGKEWVASVVNLVGPGSTDSTGSMCYNGPADPSGSLHVAVQNSEMLELRCESRFPVRHMTRVRLYAGDPRIDIENTILQNFHDPLYCSFDFNVEQPEVWHEEVGAVIQARVHSEGGHYADRKARYDHLSFNHFTWIGNQEEGIVLSNRDCLFFKLGQSTPAFLDGTSSTIHALIGGMIDPGLGIFNQGGDSLFVAGFSLLPVQEGFSRKTAMRFSLDHQNPLVSGTVYGAGEDSLPGDRFSLFSTPDPDLLLWSLKPGEEGGTIMRLWNMEEPVIAEFGLDRVPRSARSVTHVETPIDPLPVSGKNFTGTFRQQQMCTFRLDW